MIRYIAFLRGVNVGGRIISMADLKKSFEDMGFNDVKTLLNSGNVVFKCDITATLKLKKQIEEALSSTFNYPAKVFIYQIADLASLAKDYPFNTSDSGFQHYILFFEGGLEVDLADEPVDLDKNVEAISLGDGVLYWKVKKGMTLKSTFSKYLVKAKYKEACTNRNINTVNKIIAL